MGIVDPESCQGKNCTVGRRKGGCRERGCHGSRRSSKAAIGRQRIVQSLSHSLRPLRTGNFCLAIGWPSQQLFASGYLVRNRDLLDALVPENGTHKHMRSVSSSCLNTAQNCLWGLFAVPTRQEKTPTRNLAPNRCPHILSSHTGQWSRYSS